MATKVIWARRKKLPMVLRRMTSACFGSALRVRPCSSRGRRATCGASYSAPLASDIRVRAELTLEQWASFLCGSVTSVRCVIVWPSSCSAADSCAQEMNSQGHVLLTVKLPRKTVNFRFTDLDILVDWKDVVETALESAVHTGHIMACPY